MSDTSRSFLVRVMPQTNIPDLVQCSNEKIVAAIDERFPFIDFELVTVDA